MIVSIFLPGVRIISVNMDHHKLTIRNVDVLFPFKPYDLQVNYMNKVVQALQMVS